MPPTIKGITSLSNITSLSTTYLSYDATFKEFKNYQNNLNNNAINKNIHNNLDMNNNYSFGKNEQLIIFYVLMTSFLFIFMCLITQLQDCEVYLIIIEIYKYICPCLNGPTKLYKSMSNAFEQESYSNHCKLDNTLSNTVNIRTMSKVSNCAVPSFKSLSGGKLSALAIHESLTKSLTKSRIALKEPKSTPTLSENDVNGKNINLQTLLVPEGDKLTLIKQKKFLEKELSIY